MSNHEKHPKLKRPLKGHYHRSEWAIYGQNVGLLITIYERRAYSRLLNFLSLGYNCPRKVLINSDVEVVEANLDMITNAHTPEERLSMLAKIGGK